MNTFIIIILFILIILYIIIYVILGGEYRFIQWSFFDTVQFLDSYYAYDNNFDTITSNYNSLCIKHGKNTIDKHIKYILNTMDNKYKTKKQTNILLKIKNSLKI